VSSIQALVSVVSLQILKLPYAIDYLLDERLPTDTFLPSFVDIDCQKQVNAALLGAADNATAIASPATLAWTLIMQTLRTVVQSDQGELPSDDDTSMTDDRSPSLMRQSSINISKKYSDAMDNVMSLIVEEDPIQYLAKAAVNTCQVFSVIAGLALLLSTVLSTPLDACLELHARVSLLELIRQGLTLANYGPEVVDATLAVLGSNTYDRNLGDDRAASINAALVQIFVNDNQILMPSLLEQARNRYPYESAPFINLCKSLSSRITANGEGNLLVTTLLQSTSKFTQALPRDFVGYEDESQGCVTLTEDLPLYFGRQLTGSNRSFHTLSDTALVSIPRSEIEGHLIIPRGTTGCIARETKPPIIVWDHEHSPLKYFASLLSTAPASSGRVSTTGYIERDCQADIISLLAALVHSSSNILYDGNLDCEAARNILTEASDCLPRNDDIVTLVFEILDEELSRLSLHESNDNTELLVSCISFLRAVTKVMPGRAWPFLARSKLLGLDGRGSKIAAVVASVEVPAGQFRFLSECQLLLDDLIQDIVCHAVSRKVPNNESTNRFDDEELNLVTGVPDRIMGTILSAFTKVFVDVLQSVGLWKFARQDEKTVLSTRTVATLQRILHYVYDFDSSQESSQKLMDVLTSAAKFLTSTLLSSSTKNLTVDVLLRTLASDATTLCLSVYAPNKQHYITQSVNIIQFLTALIDIAVMSDTSLSFLERQLFSTVPVLIHLYVLGPLHQNSVLSLLSALVRSAERSQHEPPSLFGHLGPETAQDFLMGSGNFNEPLETSNLEIEIWQFLSTIVSSRQQWFSTILLTGDTPKNALRTTDRNAFTERHGRALLDVALDTLGEADSMSTESSLARLRFVAAAQNNWSWVTSKINKHSRFLMRTADYLADLKHERSNLNMDQSVIVAKHFQSAAFIAEIFAVFLQNMRQIGDTSFVKSLTPKLTFLREHGTSVPEYRTSLHIQLKQNFKRSFPECTLSSFHRVRNQAPFGRSYFYDVDFAGEMLAYHKSWKPTNGQGLAEEMARANCNLSLVDAQISLLTGWKLLAIELSRSIPNEKSVQKHMTSVVQQCLLQSDLSNLPQRISGIVTTTRLDLALIVLQRLVSARADSPSIKSLLPAAWDIIRASDQNFEVAFIGTNAEYYRALLRILLFTLQPYTYLAQPEQEPVVENGSPYTALDDRMREPEAAPIILEIIAKVVAKGFRCLSTQLHEDPDHVLTSDFALLTAIFRSILRIRDVRTLASQIALCLSDSNASRYATALFSWSDRLTAPDNDPILGELSISFLQEMSNVPPMAEFLATEGVLSQLNTANLMNNFRRAGGIGVFDSLRSLHTIWSRGILPLCLNTLTAVGQAFAPEVTAFLNNFPNQLERSVSALDSKALPSASDPLAGCIAVNLASEIHTLALISLILDRYRASGTAAAVDVIPELQWDRATVREELESWLHSRRSALRERIVPTTETEMELSRSRAVSGKDNGSETALEERVVADLKGALRCLANDL